jgi:two-component system sensor histidine kinase MtrB
MFARARLRHGEGVQLGLRARTTIALGLVSLLVSVVLSLMTYTLVRSYLLAERERVVERQTFTNARVVRDVLRSPDPKISDLLASLRSEVGSLALVRYQGAWYGTGVGPNQDELPADFRAQLDQGVTSSQRFSLGGQARMAVGVVIPSVDAAFVEVFSFDQLEHTLSILRNSLLAGTAVVTSIGALLGFWSSRRVLRPVARVANAAELLASGGLGTRLAHEPDPDLARMVRSFNEMADAIQLRIEREARFASDVSHELRTPLAALAASVAVLNRRRDELTDRSRQAFDILGEQIERFNRMVIDLLEISRIEAGTADVHLDEVHPVELIRRIVAGTEYASVPVVARPAATEAVVMLDKRRCERIVVNLLDNARLHGGGAVRVAIDADEETVWVCVDDAGPGVPEASRERIFERFARGPGSHQMPGTGLGLALVREHAALFGAFVTVEDAAEGGARFVLTVPRYHPEETADDPPSRSMISAPTR